MLNMLLVTWPDLQTMLSSLMSSMPSLWHLVAGFSFVTGMIFGVKGVYILKEYGELRTMMSAQTSLKKPIIMFVCAAALLYMPSVYHMSLQTLFGQGTASPLAWSTTNYDSWHGIVTVVVNIVEFVGAVAFVRGWIIISSLAGHHGQQNTFGKAVTHIIGGVLAMNITGTASVLSNTFHINLI